jgi:hypothetical protein
MIIDFLLNFIYAIVTFAISFIIGENPVDISQEQKAAIETAVENISRLDMVFPFEVFFQVLGILLLFETVYLLYKATMWVVKRLPTQS